MASGSVTPRCPPPQLSGYIFTERIGTGTYATVYKAYRKVGQREVVAIKCINKASLNNTSKENLLTEIELLKTLQHENIIELKDFMWDDNYVYLITEYCGGGDLLSYLHSNRVISESITRRFLQQLAAALKYMRSKHVSHMDLKPSNILLTSGQNPHLKIGDFGFAHYLIGETEALFLRGSLLYMAPEIITTRQYNEKADLWSVGVILYECLFGYAPFMSKSVKDLETKIRDSSPIEIPYGAHISKSCRNFLLRLLQRDPDQRMTYEEFFSHRFLDLDHLPSADSLQMASDIVTKAIDKDLSHDYHEAITLYCKALEHFMSAIRYESDSKKQQLLREKVSEYISRAEELKLKIKPKPETIQENLNPFEELVKLSQNHPKLTAALKLIQVAETKEKLEEYEAALEKYELCLGVLIKLLPEEAAGRRRELLHAQVSLWMSRAESIKQYLTVRDLETREDAPAEMETETETDHKSTTCVLQ